MSGASGRRLRVVAVCMGNICRSPTAEAVLRARLAEAGLADLVEVDSAGTYGGHEGAPPDRRAQEAARRRGYDLSRQRSRALRASDADADLLLVMDRANLRASRRIVGEGAALHLYMGGGRAGGGEVPDPYYGGEDGFDMVLDLIEEGAEAWLDRIRERLVAAGHTAAGHTKAPPGGSGT